MRVKLDTEHERRGIDGATPFLEIACATNATLNKMLEEVKGMRDELKLMRLENADIHNTMKTATAKASDGMAKADEVIAKIHEDIQERKTAK